MSVTKALISVTKSTNIYYCKALEIAQQTASILEQIMIINEHHHAELPITLKKYYIYKWLWLNAVP
jgi:hypothetical protein